MTHTVGRKRRRRIPRAWLIPLTAAVLVLVAASGGLLSRAVLLDFVAWWPVWLGVGLLAYFGRDSSLGKVRIAGLVPLLATVLLAVFVYGYFASWALMPSSASVLVGPETSGVDEAALSSRIDGKLVVGASPDGFLYKVTPSRRGGDIPAAEAVEQTRGSVLAVELTPISETGLYLFAGWEIALARGPVWSLTLEGEVSGDVSDLILSEMHLIGSGQAVLGTADGVTPISVEGTFTLIVDSGAVARVIGEATVPDTWTRVEGGWTSPVDGDGWVISVASGASLVVSER